METVEGKRRPPEAHSPVRYRGPLHEMTQTTPTCLWNDSAAVEELRESIADGAVGATCNPVIAATILKREIKAWRPVIQDVLRQMPTATEDQVAWKLVEKLSVDAAQLLAPVYAEHRGRNGRLSIQTDPRLYRDAEAIVAQAVAFDRLAPNMIVKIPVTRAGIAAIEEATRLGISINATVSFSLPQCVAVAEAVERGLRRREAEGHDVSTMGPVCTIMVGRLDDWLKVVMERAGISIEPGHVEWAGVAVFKRTYQLYSERGYRLRLLSAAFRNHMHWSELMGADAVISPPFAWQKRLNASGIEVRSRIGEPVDPAVVAALLVHFPDFKRAYSENGIAVEDFDDFPPSRRTLRQFIAACDDLAGLVRDVMLPNPDVA